MGKDPNLFSFTRKRITRAVSIGLFAAFIPLPAQMLIAGTLAWIFSANLPIAVALVWVTNPITMGPLFYFAYCIGEWLLGQSEQIFHLKMSWDTLRHDPLQVGLPLLVGSLFCGLLLGSLSHLVLNLIWRFQTNRRWLNRPASKIK